MQFDIRHAPTFSTLDFALDAGEHVSAQPDSMIAMTTGFEVRAALATQMSGSGGLMRGFKSLAVGESFFTANYTAKRDGERITLGPEQMGEIVALPVDETQRWCLASGAFLAMTGPVTIDVEYVGVRGFLSTRGLFIMRTGGGGTVFVASYGAVVREELAEGQRLVIDNRYIVAFSQTVTFQTVTLTGSLKHSFLSGEGLVNRFQGPGTVLYQTRGRPSAGMLRGLLQTIF